jgi:hypothetical protein
MWRPCAAEQPAAVRHWQPGAFLVWRSLGKLFSEALARYGITITSGLALALMALLIAARWKGKENGCGFGNGLERSIRAVIRR